MVYIFMVHQNQAKRVKYKHVKRVYIMMRSRSRVDDRMHAHGLVASVVSGVPNLADASALYCEYK